MAQRSPGLIGAIRIDLLRLHETWMEVVFPRQLDPGHVLGKWKPETGVQTAGYYLWAAFGLPLVLVGYPLLLVGYGTRFYATKLDSALFGRIGGRATSVLLAYPAAMTALFLPPVVAALFEPTLQEIIFPRSEELAIEILDGPLSIAGLNDIIRDQFTLEGVGYVLMWLSLSVPLGWFLGGLVAFANIIRPQDD